MAERRWKRPHPVQILFAVAVGLALLSWVRGLMDPPVRSSGGGDAARGGPLVAPP